MVRGTVQLPPRPGCNEVTARLNYKGRNPTTTAANVSHPPTIVFTQMASSRLCPRAPPMKLSISSSKECNKFPRSLMHYYIRPNAHISSSRVHLRHQEPLGKTVSAVCLASSDDSHNQVECRTDAAVVEKRGKLQSQESLACDVREGHRYHSLCSRLTR